MHMNAGPKEMLSNEKKRRKNGDSMNMEGFLVKLVCLVPGGIGLE